MTLSHCLFETDFGWMALGSDRVGIRKSTLPTDSLELCKQEISRWGNLSVLNTLGFSVLIKRVQSYLSGSNENFRDISLSLARPNTFFEKAWTACREVPRGETRSYSWLASQAGSPGAARAAGQAMAKNPVPLLIPCHRIIGTTGKLTGFGKGTDLLDLKSKLLKLEMKRTD